MKSLGDRRKLTAEERNSFCSWVSGFSFGDGFSESDCAADLERGDVVNARVDGAIGLHWQSRRAGLVRQRVADMSMC